jgi:hypothetical protein
MMRWSYKTVHFELKKEGLLGSAFLDESEVEQSLNEYGKAGWELVSVLETMDGLIAIFKQPLNLEVPDFYPLEEPEAKVEPAQQVQHKEEILEELPEETLEESVLLKDFEVVEDKNEEVFETSKPPLDVGTIRIE